MPSPQDYQRCSQIVTHSKIKCEEKQSTFILNNPQRHKVNKIRVDSCLFDDTVEKCDYVLATTENATVARAFFIELKGSNIKKALSQLAATLRNTQNNFETYQKKCFVVTTRIKLPKSSPKLDQQKRDFYRKNRVQVELKNQLYEASFE